MNPSKVRRRFEISFELDATEEEVETLISKLSFDLRDFSSWQSGKFLQSPSLIVAEVPVQPIDPSTYN